MKLIKRLSTISVSIMLASAFCINVGAESIYNDNNSILLEMPYYVSATASSYTNTFTPSSALRPNTGSYVDSIHYTYNLGYTKAKATPYFSITIPANSGSGSVSVEFDLVHQGQVKFQKVKTINFSNKSSKQVLNITKIASSEFSVTGSSNTDTYARFKATSTNSKINNTNISATLDVKYY